MRSGMKALTSMAASMMLLGATVKGDQLIVKPSADPREPKTKKSHAPNAGQTSIQRGKKGAWRRRKKQPPTKYADTRQQRRFEARMEHKRNTTKAERRKPYRRVS